MKNIILSTGHVALVDDEDYESLVKFKWNLLKTKGHLYASFNRTILMHRVIMAVNNDSLVVDHKNGDGLDNQKSNLRVGTQSQNLQNMKIRNQIKPKTSKFKGVYWFKRDKRWHVRVARKHIGYFDNEEDAARAYDKAALEIFGEFALTNQMLGLL